MNWKQAWQIAVIFWCIPIIVFAAGYVWAEMYSRLKKKWKQVQKGGE